VDVVAYWGDATQADESALMAAARLSQPLKALDREAILSAVSKVPHRTTAELDQLSGAAAAALAALEAEKPHQQGYAIALWLRTVLGTSNAAPLDPSSLLRKWDVHVEDLPALDARLDAVACWGKDHGPAVLVNPAGQHSASAAGRRATLAHEILHLLVDRSRELPAAEVFGGATPRHLEQRARAFAAELLLPRAVANRELAKWNSLIQAEKHIRKTYGVSKEVLGWQLKNGSAWSLLDARERALVRQWTRSWVALDSA
jgi:Zn-dependent peptidase ImmA (M78 family)